MSAPPPIVGLLQRSHFVLPLLPLTARRLFCTQRPTVAPQGPCPAQKKQWHLLGQSFQRDRKLLVYHNMDVACNLVCCCSSTLNAGKVSAHCPIHAGIMMSVVRLQLTCCVSIPNRPPKMTCWWSLLCFYLSALGRKYVICYSDFTAAYLLRVCHSAKSNQTWSIPSSSVWQLAPKAQLVLQGDAYDINYGIELNRHIHGNAAEQ